jgi:quinoprotein glucose dehydrogenase
LQLDGPQRAGALLGLASFPSTEMTAIIQKSLDDKDHFVRAAARTLLVRSDRQNAGAHLWKALREGTDHERQIAIRLLADLAAPDADEKIATIMKLMLNDQVPAAVRLDILQAVRRRAPAVEELQQLLIRYESSWDPKDPVAAYDDTLQGGDARRGARLFYESTALQCTKCHRIGDQGSKLGPDLTHIGSQRQRRQLAESIAYPNQTITEGYDTVILETKKGAIVSGIVQQRTEDSITVADEAGNLRTFAKDEIDSTTTGKSAMPENLVEQMSLFQLRDLIEFLATQK